jgi:sporulation protein YlmC with PRC-barrel domain
MAMLITHLKSSELWGKNVYDVNGNFLGKVVAIASRRGVVRKVVVQLARYGQQVKVLAKVDARVEADTLFVPVPQPTAQPRLRIVR